jgi:hypothetical protein
MRRAAFLTIFLAFAVLAPAGPAAADFHTSCSPFGTAAVNNLTVSGDPLAQVFNFSGTVNCGGAQSITITSLTMRQTIPPGPTFSAGSASCGPCGTLTHSGTAPALPGAYRVEMRFTVVSASGQSFPNRFRAGNFVWLGTGQPIRTA